jgi:hypothetical protein
MGRINAWRVVSGGILAGLVVATANIVGAASNMGNWENIGVIATGVLRRPLITVAHVAELVLGLAMAWLYAVARPRLGGGGRTAVLMGLVCWVLAYGTTWAMMTVWLPAESTGGINGATLWGLAGCVAGSLVAGAVYRENARGARRR